MKVASSGPEVSPVSAILIGKYNSLPFKPVFAAILPVHSDHVFSFQGSSGNNSFAAVITSLFTLSIALIGLSPTISHHFLAS